MTTSTTTSRPYRVQWLLPAASLSWRIELGEDGVELVSPSGDALEQHEVLDLIELLTHVLEVSKRDDDELVPRPLTVEEVKQRRARHSHTDSKIMAPYFAEQLQKDAQ